LRLPLRNEANRLGLSCEAFLLQTVEFGHCFGEGALDGGLVAQEEAHLFHVGGVEEEACGGFVGVEFGIVALYVRDCLVEDGGFVAAAPVEAPVCFREGFDGCVLEVARGGVGRVQGGAQFVEGGAVFGAEDEGFAG
jgi:hypothetical protein